MFLSLKNPRRSSRWMNSGSNFNENDGNALHFPLPLVSLQQKIIELFAVGFSHCLAIIKVLVFKQRGT